MTDQWHRPLRHIRGTQLSGDTRQTSGMTRFEAISGATVGSAKIWMGRTHVAAGTASGDHHHGDTETAIYVVSGRPAFVFADGDAEVRIETEPGDYVFVPPFVPHREENPGPEEAVVVIARSSQEGVVVNLPSLWAAPDERAADRDAAADVRDSEADQREIHLEGRSTEADARDQRAASREEGLALRQRAVDERDRRAELREVAVADREAAADERDRLADLRSDKADARDQVADQREIEAELGRRDLNR